MTDPFPVFVIPGHRNCPYAIERNAMGHGVQSLALRVVMRMMHIDMHTEMQTET